MVVQPFLLISLLLVGVMLKHLADLYLGGRYVCPSCGARSAGHHSPDCPWNRPPVR